MLPHKPTPSRLPTTFWIDIGLICLAFFLFYLTLDFPRMAGTFPRLVLIMIVSVTLLDLILIVRPKQQTAAAQAASEQALAAAGKSQWKVFYLAALTFVFYGLMQFLGLILGTFAFILLAGRTLGYTRKVRLFVASLIITVSVYLIFETIMQSYLPQGYVFGLIGG